MIILNGAASNGDQLLLNSNSSGFANIAVHCSYVDYNSANGVVTPAANDNFVSANVANQVIVANVANANNARNIKACVIHNANASANNTVSIMIANGAANANLYTLYSYTLLPGETLQYYDTLGWQVLNANGQVKVTTFTPGGTVLKETWYTSVASAQTFTTPANTGNVWVRAIGGGGAGGSVNGAASNAAAASGGGAGAYCEVYTPASPSTGYTYNVGQGGNAVAGANSGNSGTATNISIAGNLYNANGGTGGATMTSAATANTFIAGSAGGTVGTVGNLNSAGEGGGASIRFSANLVKGGMGGTSQFGGGGQEIAANTAAGNGANGSGPGAGGSGAVVAGGNATNANGGNGANGMLIIFEYT